MFSHDPAMYVYLLCMVILTPQDSTRPSRRHVTFDDHVTSSGEISQSEESDAADSHSDKKQPYKLSARTKQTAHKAQSSDSEEGSNDDSEGSHNDSPSGYLDLEAEEVWQLSEEGRGSSDMDDFIDDCEEAESGSCDAELCDVSEASRKEVGVALPVSKQCFHGRRILDSSSNEGECMVVLLL